MSYLNIRTKLSLIEYNKKIKDKLEIDIESYKKMSRKEIIFEKNGHGEEYDMNTYISIFEGKYKYGKRNRKGKEYDNNGILIFEGEYLNDKRIGKGKEYRNKKLIYEGEYLNGERNGKRKKI